jgi:uncharacterized membrane protein
MRHPLLKLALAGALAAGMTGMALADCASETVAQNATPVEAAEAGTTQTSGSAAPGSFDVAAGSGPANRGVSRPVAQPVIPIGTPMRQPITPSVPQPPRSTAPAR